MQGLHRAFAVRQRLGPRGLGLRELVALSSFRFEARRLRLRARGEQRQLSVGDLRCVRLARGLPGLRRQQLAITQQQCLETLTLVPAPGVLCQARVLAHPVEVGAKGARHLTERAGERKPFGEKHVVQPAQVLRNRFVIDLRADDGNDPFRQFNGLVHLPGAARRLHGFRRQDEDHRVGALNQGGETDLPVLGRGDVVPIQDRIESQHFERRDQFLGERA